MIVSYTHELPMGHRLQRHEGKCRTIHGHNYVVTVTVAGPINVHTGMVVDFHDLKVAVRAVLERYDHALVLEDNDPVVHWLSDLRDPSGRAVANVITLPFPPTAENLALHWLGEFQDRIGGTLAATINVSETRDCEVSA